MQFAKEVWDTSKAVDRKHRASNRTHMSLRKTKGKEKCVWYLVCPAVPLWQGHPPCSQKYSMFFWESAWSDKAPPACVAQHWLQGFTPPQDLPMG